MDCNLKIKTSQFLKKITQLLVSISLFSLLLSHFSNLSYLQSLAIYFPSNISLHLLSQTKDKNTMFLLCNGLLVFMKFYGLISSSSTPNTYDHNSMDCLDPCSSNYKHDTLILEQEEPTSLLDKEAPQGNQSDNYMQVEAQEKEGIEELEDLQEKEEDNEEGGGGCEIENGFSMVGKEDKEMEEGEDYVMEDKYEVVDEREEEEGNGVVSIEELNKIFDEFIRKMKEGIRIEPQQQMVAVK